MAKTRLKAQTLAAPQSREETQNWIKDLGDIQREHTRAVAAMNDEIATITERHKSSINALADRAKELQSGIQSWCEANRGELTAKGKTVNLITGEVSWRLRPPSIRIRSQEAVLEALRTLGLTRFVRVKEEVNKDAMLAEMDIAATVSGGHRGQGRRRLCHHPARSRRSTAMKTLIDWLIGKLRRRDRLSYHLRDADGTIEIRQGWHTVRLSHSDYLLLQQLKGWQQ